MSPHVSRALSAFSPRVIQLSRSLGVFALAMAGVMPLWVSAEARARDSADASANPPDRSVASATVVESSESTTREIPTSAGQPASNRRMALLLQDIYQRADPMRNQFRCTEQVFLLRRELASGPARDRIQELQYTLAKQLLQSGLPEEALEEFKALERMARESGAPLDARKESLLATSKALCHLQHVRGSGDAGRS